MVTRRTPCAASQRNWWAANGSPATGSKILGRAAVSGNMRVASPPARITHGRSAAGEDDGTIEVESEPRLRQAVVCHRSAECGRLLCVEHQESSGTSSD